MRLILRLLGRQGRRRLLVLMLTVCWLLVRWRILVIRLILDRTIAVWLAWLRILRLTVLLSLCIILLQRLLMLLMQVVRLMVSCSRALPSLIASILILCQDMLRRSWTTRIVRRS
jgi:hypothetical protein